ncbi:MAG: sugar nucleotide-binding protein [Proteobacteria bacterium]|nr:sugar nucleotide-binding protein [Pseudomonadota bacterium]
MAARGKNLILITGGTGLLGPYLAAAAARRGAVMLAGRRRGQKRADLSDAAAARRLIAEAAPDIVVHAAAWADVDGCEREPERADAINRQATANVAAAMPAGCRLVVVSTDQVYPDRPGPHREGTEAPVNAYGRSKLAGEAAALAAPGALVLRTNFFGPSRTRGRRSLSDFVLDSLRAAEPVTLFGDVLFSPLHMATLAEIVFELVEAEIAGTFNLGSRDGMSKSEFGLAVAAVAGVAADTATIGESTMRAGRAPRAKDLRMDVGKLERALGRPMPTLAEEVEKL